MSIIYTRTKPLKRVPRKSAAVRQQHQEWLARHKVDETKLKQTPKEKEEAERRFWERQSRDIANQMRGFTLRNGENAWDYFKRMTAPEGGCTKPTPKDPRLQYDDDEMVARELRAREESERLKTRVAPLYNKGGYQLVTEGIDPKDLGRKTSAT